MFVETAICGCRARVGGARNRGARGRYAKRRLNTSDNLPRPTAKPAFLLKLRQTVLRRKATEQPAICPFRGSSIRPFRDSASPFRDSSIRLPPPCACAEEVYSSNIVGYQKVQLQPGFNFVAPQFVAVGGDSIDLQSVRLDVADEDVSYVDNVQILDDGGATIAAYAWLPAADTASGEKSGWVDNDTGDLAEVEVNNGLSVLIEANDDSTVTISGEVPTDTATITSVAGFNWIGNSSPKPIDIQDIQIDIADEDVTYVENIQILDDGGATIAAYAWLPAADTASGEKSGWVDNDTGDLAEVTLQPGQGVLLETQDAGVTITIPSALTPAE